MAESKLNKNMLTLVLVTFAITVVLSFIPIAKHLLYPFKLFSTFVHEACHGLAAVITGGSWINYSVSADGSGLAMTSGGLRMIVIPAGYLGTSIIGGILLLLSSRLSNKSNAILFILGFAIALTTVFLGRSVTTYLFGIGFGAVLIIISVFFKGVFPVFLLNFLAVNLSLNALFDVRTLFFHTTGNYGSNDAVSMNNEILRLGSLTWAIIFIAFTLLITYVFVKKAMKVKVKEA